MLIIVAGSCQRYVCYEREDETPYVLPLEISTDMHAPISNCMWCSHAVGT